MKKLLLGMLVSVVVAVVAAPAPAQQLADQLPSEEELDEATRIRLDVTRVNILFTVTDKRGRFVTDLAREDFEVFEKNDQQNILEFSALSDLPLRLGILIDTSNSIRDRFRFQQEAAIEFINSVVRPDVDRAVVVSFDSSVNPVSELTGDPEALAESIRELRPGGGTALYDAILHTCRDKLMVDRPRHKFRRAIVILSDGEDNQSHYTRDQALEMAHRADAVLYTISTNISRVQTTGDKVLKYYAEETGGLVFFPFKVEDLTQSFENIANELRHQYNILYRPEPLEADGLYHPVRIRVKNQKNLIVRARKGYYAPTF